MTFKVDKIFGNINISINVTTKVVTFSSPIGGKVNSSLIKQRHWQHLSNIIYCI